MNKIIDPGAAASNQFPTLAKWVDAFTLVQECSADAKHNPEIRKNIADNIKQLESESKRTKDGSVDNILKDQKLIQQQMEMKMAVFKQVMQLWKNVSKDIIAASWDLTEEVHYQEQHKGGPLRFWQGDKDAKSGGLILDRPSALVAIKFLKFVAAESQQTDPLTYTKNMLLSQGINEHNFHLYADSIAFPNPWKAKQ